MHCFVVKVVFYALDLAISYPGDWLQYKTITSLGGFPNSLISLDSNSTVTNEPIYTGASQLGLYFHADSDFEDRGFWIQFVGRSCSCFLNKQAYCPPPPPINLTCLYSGGC